MQNIFNVKAVDDILPSPNFLSLGARHNNFTKNTVKIW